MTAPTPTPISNDVKLRLAAAVQQARAVADAEPAASHAPSVTLSSPEVEPPHADFERRPLNDLGNAQRFCDLQGAHARYVHDQRCWYVWNGCIWEPDASKARVRLRAREVLDRLTSEALACEDEAAAERLHQFVRRSGSCKALNDMIDLARDHLPEEPSRFDADPYLLSFRNGTLDLRTLTLRDHRADDYLSKQVPFDYDPTGKAPRFVRALEEVQPDPEVRAFLQRLAGLSLVGANHEEMLVVFYGDGCNGKTKVIEALAHALGPGLAAKVPESTMVRSNLQGQSAHQSDLAKLEGNRLVFVDETNEHVFLDCARVKALTGADGIEVRKAHAPDSRTLSVTWLPFLCTNFRPKVIDTSHSIWRRLVLIEFPVRVEKPDLRLKEKLRAEAPGILAWAVEGLRQYQAIGLGIPEICRRAADQYRAAEDLLGEFIEDCLDREPGRSCARQIVYDRYVEWARGQGLQPEPQVSFKKKLEARGFTPGRSGKGRMKVWLDCGLRWIEDCDETLAENEERLLHDRRRGRGRSGHGVVPLAARRARS
jgi:putative DNA primase/helicase